MLVRLNAFRAGANPGDIVDVSDVDAAALITHGAAFPADDIDAELAKAETADGRTVRGAATLQSTSGADASETPAP
jgi:hypothetical protein